jgi:outer membrane protein assembly factor BamB
MQRAISAGSGSTWWRQSRHQTIRRTRAAAALPKVIGGPVYLSTAAARSSVVGDYSEDDHIGDEQRPIAIAR